MTSEKGEKEFLTEEIRRFQMRLDEIEGRSLKNLTPEQVELVKAANALEWTSYRKGRTGEWAFSRDQQGNQGPEQKALTEAIQRSKGKLIIGSDVYEFSGEDDKFIARSERK